jgi:H+/Cl- antiporter ClcA
MTTFVAEKMSMSEDNSKLLVLTGMSAAMGGVFPTPVLGVLMIHELGNPPRYICYVSLKNIG